MVRVTRVLSERETEHLNASGIIIIVTQLVNVKSLYFEKTVFFKYVLNLNLKLLIERLL